MPSENPELREQVGEAVPVVEYGNVLDEASVRMVVDVLDDLRGRRLRTAAAPPPRCRVADPRDIARDVLGDRAGRRPRAEHLRDPHALEMLGVVVGDRATDQEEESSISFSLSISQSSSAYSMCAPDRLESPSTAASSSITARRIDSGVWKMPV